VWWGRPARRSFGDGGWFSFSLIPRSRPFLSGRGGGGGWVEHNDRFMVVVVFGPPGSARCWVLRGHPGLGCVFGPPALAV
jgi:hypothetical protein